MTLEIKHTQTVVWECLYSNMQDTDAWQGTKIIFSIKGFEGKSILEFLQTGYKQSPCYNTCNDGWRYVLGTSLKSYLETGAGMPYEC